MMKTAGRSCDGRRSAVPLSAVAIALCAQFGAIQNARALEIDTGIDQFKLRWDNTVKYNAGWRVKKQSDVVAGDANTNDGDRNFSKGLISNRLDLLSEVDATYQNVGLRVSAAAWYDQVYNSRNDNPGGLAFSNNASVPYNEFTDATKKVHGRNSEFLDAFVFGKFNLGGVDTTVRLGKHTVVYGESLFFGSNGIAAAQGPVDVVKLVTVPGSQFKEILRPVEQVSTVLQFSRNLTLGAYYQFRWHASRIPAVGSYFSPADFAGQGAEQFYAGPLGIFGKTADMKAKDSGQGGIQLRWAPDNSEWEYGLYAARYHDKTPYFYFLPTLPLPGPYTAANDKFQQVYHQGTRTFGASATTSIGQLNLAFEGSIRTNASLVSDPQFVSPASNNSDNPAYAVGKTGHLQASAIYVLTGSPLWDAGSFLGEIAWNRRLSVSRNEAAIDPNTTRDAAALRFIFEPQYFQVAQGLDLGIPVGLGWNFKGRSSSIFLFNGGYANAGDVSVGLNATYKTVWQAGLNFTHYFGTANSFLAPANSSPQVLSFNQFYKDRDFISLTLKRAF